MAADAGPFVSLALVLLGTGAALGLASVIWSAWLMHRPARMAGGRALARLGRLTPADVGLRHEEMPFRVPDAARPGRRIGLAAWWLPHPGGVQVERTCVIVHSYGDSKIGALAWAPAWQSLGFHLLLVDLRAHGESEGRSAGGGAWEGHELASVLDELALLRPREARQVVLFGVSYGGLVASQAAAGREGLAALVLDSPIGSWPAATGVFARLVGAPFDAAHRLRLRLAEAVLKVRFSDATTARGLAGVACPTLLILPPGDPLLSEPEVAEIVAALGGARAFEVWRPRAGHNVAIAVAPQEWLERVGSFVRKYAIPPSEAGEASGTPAG